MGPLLLTVGAVLSVVVAAAGIFFAYSYHRYHAVPLVARPCSGDHASVEVGGFRLHVRELGTENGGVPIVVLHGGPGHSLLSFRDGLDFLGEKRRVLLYDQRGSGLSEVKPGVDAYSAQALVEELDEIRRTVLHADTIDVIAHSAGGALAQQYLIEHSAHVRRLVLVGSTSANNNMSHSLVWRVLGPGLYATAMGLPPADPVQADAWFQSDQVASDSHRLFDPDDLSPVTDTGPITFATWFAVSQSLAGDDRAAQLRTLPTPTLVLYGEADSPYTGARAAERIAGTLPAATAVCVPRSGHWPFLENRPEFQRVVGTFLAPEA
ncbi:MAG: alpha/beta fold hydrolase [Actinomycetales bacterium]|nr:alpha/beta fold hydrolase [Actinomycetales bacterium]